MCSCLWLTFEKLAPPAVVGGGWREMPITHVAFLTDFNHLTKFHHLTLLTFLHRTDSPDSPRSPQSPHSLRSARSSHSLTHYTNLNHLSHLPLLFHIRQAIGKVGC
eukprot:GHVN01015932.1.p1 GENE.GHVN01015932.1~~GHVN01015932.1.p1  ORF type:complete len:106 (-),score=42.01 GHVN01015932.1:873-1190(-)